VSKRIVVNVGLLETRVAVQEGNLLTELYLERSRHRSIVGGVYKGTVTNVLPGMQAAFVDIGLTKDAFLYAGDFTANLAEVGRTMLAAADEDVDPDGELDGDEEPRREAAGPIEEMLSRGDTVLVPFAAGPGELRGRLEAVRALPPGPEAGATPPGAS